jgi:hypothetical protein
MPTSDYVYERGDGIRVGSHGGHSYVFASGDPVNDGGASDLVFESGTGLGSQGMILSSNTTGVHETGYTHTEFYNYQGTESGHGSFTDYHAAGLQNGVSPSWANPANNRNERTIMLGLHYSTASGTYGLVYWQPGPTGTDKSWEVQAHFRGLGDHVLNGIVVHDGADYGEQQDNYGTINGDPAPGWTWVWDPSDGCIVEVEQGTYTFTLVLKDPEYSNNNPDQPDTILAYGPNGVYEEVAFSGYGQEIEFTIDV